MDLSSILFFKPILTTLIVPPAGPLLVVLLGWLISLKSRQQRRRIAQALIFTGAAGLWILSCQVTSVWLSKVLLPQFTPVNAEAIKNAQVVLVLGGGTDSYSPEYNGPELTAPAYERLRYGVHLSKSFGLPLTYAGGVAWGADANALSEAEVAKKTLKRDWNLELKLSEGRSKDTRQNAIYSYSVLSKAGITKVALVTHAWHMPRAARNFREAGFEVIPAPMGFITSSESNILDALPSETGLRDSRWIIKEWLGLLIT